MYLIDMRPPFSLCCLCSFVSSNAATSSRNLSVRAASEILEMCLCSFLVFMLTLCLYTIVIVGEAAPPWIQLLEVWRRLAAATSRQRVAHVFRFSASRLSDSIAVERSGAAAAAGYAFV